MSEATVSYTNEDIYIPLKDEGTFVLRPTKGLYKGAGIYEILPTADYEFSDESWLFTPGSLVKCIIRVEDNKEILIANELVENF